MILATALHESLYSLIVTDFPKPLLSWSKRFTLKWNSDQKSNVDCFIFISFPPLSPITRGMFLKQFWLHFFVCKRNQIFFKHFQKRFYTFLLVRLKKQVKRNKISTEI